MSEELRAALVLAREGLVRRLWELLGTGKEAEEVLGQVGRREAGGPWETPVTEEVWELVGVLRALDAYEEGR